MQYFLRIWVGVLVAVLPLQISAAEKPSLDGLILPEDVFPQLREILENALDQSPRMIERNLRLLEAEHEANVAKSRQYPKVSGYGFFLYQIDDRVDREMRDHGQKTNYDVRATQPLYHWGALRDGTRMEQMRTEIESRNMLEAYRLLALSVRSGYLSLVVSRAIVVREQTEYDRQVRRLDKRRMQVESGEAPSSVLDSEGLVLSERQVDLERANLGFETALRGFRRLTGLSNFQASQIPDTLPTLAAVDDDRVAPLKRNYVEKRGFENSARISILSLDLQRERLQERIARRNLWPKLNFQVGVTQNELSYTANVGAKFGVASAFGGFRVTWNIFDSQATRERVRASKVRQRSLEARLENLEQQLRDEALVGAESVRISGMAMLNSDRRYIMSQSGLAFATENLERGLASQENVDNAAYNESVARVTAFAARSSYLNDVAEFMSKVDADPIVDQVAPKILKR